MNKNKKSDQEQVLIQGLLAGEEQCFIQLLKTHHQALRRLAVSFVGESVADDVMQDAWISVVKGLPQFRGQSSLKTWLYRIVVNTAISRLRKESTHKVIVEAELSSSNEELQGRFNKQGGWQTPPIPWFADSPDAILESEELYRVIKLEIEQLPTLQQSVILMHDIDGLAIDTICNLLDISTSNGRVLLHRARVRVYSAIEAYKRADK